MELTTTLNRIKNHNPCAESWKRALRYLGKTRADDEPLLLLTILESNGIDDAAWGLCTLDDKYDNAVRLFICFCARYCLDIFEKEYPDDKRPRLAIETAERCAKGLVTKEELAVPRAAAWDVALAADRAAAGAAWVATDVARTATWAAAWEARTAALATAWDAQAAAWDARAAACAAALAAARDARAAALAVVWATDWDARAAAWAAVRDARAAALAVARDARACFADEFKRLCLLEGEYGEVVIKDGE